MPFNLLFVTLKFSEKYIYKPITPVLILFLNLLKNNLIVLLKKPTYKLINEPHFEPLTSFYRAFNKVISEPKRAEF